MTLKVNQKYCMSSFWVLFTHALTQNLKLRTHRFSR